jgi:glycerol-3-phosphate acyltransferase PlsY
MLLPLLLAAVVGYVLGALPFGYLVARAKGVDIFAVGSRNPGATNVRRVLGHGPGNLVLALDALKGAVAAGWPGLPSVAGAEAAVFSLADPRALAMGITGLIAAMLGHGFSCFTGFRGGKSVATGAGGFAVLFPLGMLIALGVWLVTLGLSRFVSLASILAAASLPVSAVALRSPMPLLGAAIVTSLFVIIRHRANIGRLLAGTESRVGAAKPAAGSR